MNTEPVNENITSKDSEEERNAPPAVCSLPNPFTMLNSLNEMHSGKPVMPKLKRQNAMLNIFFEVMIL